MRLGGQHAPSCYTQPPRLSFRLLTLQAPHRRARPPLRPLATPARCSYECPLESLATFYRPPARLMLSIDNMHSNGVQLTQVGARPAIPGPGRLLHGRSAHCATTEQPAPLFSASWVMHSVPAHAAV